EVMIPMVLRDGSKALKGSLELRGVWMSTKCYWEAMCYMMRLIIGGEMRIRGWEPMEL
ncbi:hypothetical protein A2U01_0097515, partial [Trifolium medium]|nr:hypothetical protein [Trifolium medium]